MPDKEKDTEKESKLLEAAKIGNMEALHAILKAGELDGINASDINAIDELSESTPLHYVAEIGDATLIDELHKAGANVNAKDIFHNE